MTLLTKCNRYTNGNDDPVYDVDELKATAKHVTQLSPSAWLFYDWREPDTLGNGWIYWYLFEFDHSTDTHKYARLTMSGEGPSGQVRELRHMYVGIDGYLFYPSIKNIREAFVELAKIYDIE